MSEQQVLPEDVAKASSHVVNDGTIAGYLMYPEYHSLQRQLAQSEAERERLQEANEQSTYLLGMRVIETATLRAELAREREANQGLREVVKEYRESTKLSHKFSCQDRFYPGLGMMDDRCSTCIKADALLEPKAKPVATTS